MKRISPIIVLIFILNFSFGQKIISYEENEKYGLKDSVGNIIVTPKYDEIYQFYGSLASVRVGDYETGKWGFIDTTGKEVIPLKYDHAFPFRNKYAVVTRISYQKTIDDRTGKPIRTKIHKYGVIDTKGKKIVSLKYELIAPLGDGEFGVKENGKWGLINKNGKIILPIMYDGVTSFSSEGLYGVKLNEKFGFVNEKNEVVIPFQFFYVDYERGFVNGKIYVQRSEHSTGFYIDKTGKEIKREGHYKL